MRYTLLICGFLLTACATQRVSLRDLQDYDHAIKIAESNGMDTTDMHKRLVEMMARFIKNPGEDPYVKAARKSADAQSWAAAAAVMQVTKPAPQPMPLSPGQFGREMGWKK